MLSKIHSRKSVIAVVIIFLTMEDAQEKNCDGSVQVLSHKSIRYVQPEIQPVQSATNWDTVQLHVDPWKSRWLQWQMIQMMNI